MKESAKLGKIHDLYGSRGLQPELGQEDIARGFSEIWNFEHTVGAIDGKHIRITKPPRTGSLYFNYKVFSLVPLGVVDYQLQIYTLTTTPQSWPSSYSCSKD